jgi:ABC-type nitrate/sulfonate/bicarbonate transport system ATPase subunit
MAGLRQPVLRLDGITRRFRAGGREILALDRVDFELAEGELVAVVGPSGSGKTTLLRIAAGLESVDAGSVRRGEGARIGFVFQEPRLLSSRTVEGNVALGLGSRRAEREGSARVLELLGLLGLSEFRRAYPRELSGGIAQRVAIGRALVRDPEVLFLDEPFSALDAPLRARLQDELLAVLARRGTSAVFVTHDLGEALYLGDRVVTLVRGRIVRHERIALLRPRDRQGKEFSELKASLALTLGARVFGASRADGDANFEEDTA